MTLIKPGGPVETGPPHAQLIRLATSAFISGAGVTADSDFAAAGDPGVSAISVTAGMAFVFLGVYQGLGFYPSSATVHINVNAAPRSGCRNDILGLQVWSQEMGDDHDDWQLIVLPGTVGSTTDPTPSPASAGWLPLYRIGVCAGNTSGTQFTFTRLVQQVYPRRYGGYQSSDLNVPALAVVESHRALVGASGYVTRNYQTAPDLGYTPSTIIIVGTITGGTPDLLSGYALDRSSLSSTGFRFRAFRPDGNIVTPGAFINFDVVIHS